MRLYKEKYFQIYHTGLSMLMSLALSIAINNSLALNISVSILILISMIFATSIYLIDKNKKSLITYLIIFLCFVIASIILWKKEIDLLQWIGELVDWCKNYNVNVELYNVTFALAILIITNLIGNFIFYLIMKKPITKTILAVVLIVLLFVFAVKQIEQTKLVVGIVIFYILNILIEITMTLYVTRLKRKEIRAGILYLIPICLLLTLIALMLPSKAEPIKWTLVKNAYNTIRNQIEIMRMNIDYYFQDYGNEFSLSFAGYSDGDSILSNMHLNKDDRIALIVEKESWDSGVYLSGSFRENYTGYSWEKNEEIFSYAESEYILDYAELIYALSRQEQKSLEENMFIKPSYMFIKYNLIKTNSFFYPLKTTSMRIHNSTYEPNTTFANMTFPEAVSKNTSYRINFCEININGQEFQEMLRQLDDFSYNTDKSFDDSKLKWIEENLINMYQAPILSDYDLSESLRQRARDNKQVYLQLPDTLPDRVEDLAIEITKEYDYSYDKLLAIEKYLNSYTYTLSPQATPEGQDFVDFFLFDSKEGYCTSFATSMCVLARCIDIPTRYVQGFLVDPSSTDEDGNYIIKNSQAHAWSEAYIEGIGWIPFEATPSNYDNRYSTWDVTRQENDKDNSFYEDYYRNKKQENNEDFDNLDLEDIEEIEKASTSRRVTIVIIIVIAILIILFIFLLVYYQWLRLKYKKRLQNEDLNARMYLIFTNVLWRLKNEGYNLNTNETILDFSDRINKIYTYEEINFLQVANIFMKHRYGNFGITNQEYQQMLLYYEGLNQFQKEKWKKIRYLADEFIYLHTYK